MFRLPKYVKKWWPKKKFKWKDIDSIPNCIGVYELIDENEVVVYVGKASVLRRRLFQHYYYNDIPNTSFFRCYRISRMGHASDFEAQLIMEKSPVYNVHGRKGYIMKRKLKQSELGRAF